MRCRHWFVPVEPGAPPWRRSGRVRPHCPNFEKTANIAARCTVFAESDLVHKLQVGYPREDVIAGLCKAVATNYLNNVGKGKRIQSPIVFQGGVSKNVGVVHFFEEALNQPVLVDPDGHLMGAYGAALLAADAPASKRKPFNFDISDFEFTTREVICQKCSQPLRNRVRIQGRYPHRRLGQSLRQRRNQGGKIGAGVGSHL